jgi:hypothetical protein
MPALGRFSALLEKAITIVTLADGKIWTADSLNNLPDIMWSLMQMARAHDESEQKSRRVRAAWQNKRVRAANGGHVLTARAPAWLRLRSGSFEVIEDRAAIVRRIFDMAVEGHGKAAIAHRLNIEHVESFGDGPSEARKANGWHRSYIQKILGNPAVIGRFQPMRRVRSGEKAREADGMPLEGYFPAVVDADVFYRVRPGASGHKGKPLANILSGLAVCPHCGGKLHFVNKGPGPKGGSYLACDNARRKGTCDARSVRYDVAAIALLNCLEDGELDVRALIGADAQSHRRDIARKLEAVAGRIAETDSGITNLLDVLTRRPSPAIEQRLAEHEATLKQLREEKARFEAELHSLTSDGDPAEEIAAAVRELNRKPSADVNTHLNATLKRIIARVEIGYSDEARGWFDAAMKWGAKRGKNTKLHQRLTNAIAAGQLDGRVSIAAAFHAEGRHLVISADPGKARRFIAGAARTNATGAVGGFTLKIAAG